MPIQVTVDTSQQLEGLCSHSPWGVSKGISSPFKVDLNGTPNETTQIGASQFPFGETPWESCRMLLALELQAAVGSVHKDTNTQKRQTP